LDKLGALQPLFLPLGYQLAALPFCVLLASALSLEASPNPLGGNAVAGTSAAQIAIAASGGAHIAEFGARQTNISNNSPAGHPDTTVTAETGAPPRTKRRGAESSRDRQRGPEIRKRRDQPGGEGRRASAKDRGRRVGRLPIASAFQLSH
jgi:hypothetical protein